MSVLAVTGTGTEIGKTVVTAAIAALAIAAGRGVAVLKPAQTGLAAGELCDIAVLKPARSGPAPSELCDIAAVKAAQTGLAAGELCDVDQVARLAGPVTRRELARYPEPLAPATAARRSGLPVVRPRQAAEAAAELAEDHDLVLVEGAGGLLVRYDDEGATFADVVAELGDLGVDVTVLVVTTAGLGTLNTTALTAEALRARGLPLRGLVIGSWPTAPDLAARCNLADLPAVADAPLLGALPQGCANGDRESFLATARTALAGQLGGTWDAAAFTAEHAP
ncbi:ATP-dependent dethiobiotin synthetase BioD [Nonomuraea sp. NPDC059194]|uniref:ATP-dependent dethiobiotin synthetase BioD n=1 Tax=Nonomuraea sp. NPDC059194 TaxID=3346764 RepID=UPI00369B0828